MGCEISFGRPESNEIRKWELTCGGSESPCFAEVRKKFPTTDVLKEHVNVVLVFVMPPPGNN